jgi:hypothetical protein
MLNKLSLFIYFMMLWVARSYDIIWYNDRWTLGDLEGSSQGLTKLLFHNLSGGTEENHGNLHWYRVRQANFLFHMAFHVQKRKLSCRTLYKNCPSQYSNSLSKIQVKNVTITSTQFCTIWSMTNVSTLFVINTEMNERCITASFWLHKNPY